jgi:hypothetical protein
MSKFTERRTPTLSKKRAVMDYGYRTGQGGDEDAAVFELPNEDIPTARSAVLYLDHGDFEAMGSPEVITVTIEPGDLLNVEEPLLADLPDETLIRATGTYLVGGTFTDCWARPVPQHISGANNDAERLWEVLVHGSAVFGAVTTWDRITSFEVLYTEADQ